MTGFVSIHPQQPLEPGHYLLDREGRLHPLRYRGFIKPACYVTVKLRQNVATRAEQIRAECAEEARQHEERVREVGRLTTAHPLPIANCGPDRAMRSLARRKKPTVVAVPPEELPASTDDDAAFEDFVARVARKQAERARRAEHVSEPPKVDGVRLAAAIRARGAPNSPAPKKAPTRRALGPGECTHCGIPGFRGCDHFLPYVGG